MVRAIGTNKRWCSVSQLARICGVHGLLLFSVLGATGCYFHPYAGKDGALPRQYGAEELQLAERLREDVALYFSAQRNLPRAPAALAKTAGSIKKFVQALAEGAPPQTLTVVSLPYLVPRGRDQGTPAGDIQAENIEITLRPTSADRRGEEIIIVGAHYDSAIGASGANDNGSGAAAALELLRSLTGAERSFERFQPFCYRLSACLKISSRVNRRGQNR